ncbi:MAG TPA: glycosyltransferase family 1 protein [Gemmatimonadaceae bacterium]|nr:glycosyltransferase family 1 protein [Gemmatimonadaceae bacterium]
MADRGAQRARRVLYCTDTFPPQVNGVSIVTALSVAGLRARGWQCAVVAPKYPAIMPRGPIQAAHQLDGLVEVPSVAFPPYPDIRLAAPSYGLVATAVRQFKPDIVHSATEFMIGRLGQIAASRAGVVRLSSYHTDFSRYTEAYGMPWLRGSVSKYIARFHGRSARVFTPSAPARDDLVALGVTDVEVWGRGVDINAFSPERRSQALRAAYGIDDSIVFLHVGRLAAEKGVDRIVRAFNRARASLPAGAARLIIAGAGPEENALRTLAGPDVLFLGVLDREKALPRLYASADVFLFSSLTETLGLVVLEAMAAGLPVVATPAGGVADHLRDEQNGIAVEANDVDAMADAIVALTMDTARRRRLAGGGRRTALALDWEAELDRLDASYRSVLERSERKPKQTSLSNHIFDERAAGRAAY